MKAAAFSVSRARPAVPGIQSWCLNDGSTSAYLSAVKAWSVNEQQGAQALARIDQWVQGDRKALLNLSGLTLRSLPPLHSNLRQLDASNNQVAALPEHLPELQVLILRGNALTHLPEALPVSSLYKLDIANNQLNRPPSGLHWLRPGCEIHIDGNSGLNSLQAPIGCLLDTELLVTLALHEYKKLAMLLKEFPGAVNCVDCHGNSLIHLAINEGNLNLVSLLLAHPAIDLNFLDGNGHTPLLLACQKGLDEVALLLLGCDAIDANKSDADGATPLLWALINNKKVVVQALLAKPDVNPNKSTLDGMSPLRYVIKEKNLSMFKCLTASPMLDLEQLLSNQLTPAAYIAAIGSAEMLELLLQRMMVDQQAHQRLVTSALIGACTTNEYELAGLLLRKYRCNVNAAESLFHSSPLCMAASVDDSKMVSLLLRHGANPNAEVAGSITALQAAIAQNSIDCVRVLLAVPGINPNARSAKLGAPPLQYAAQKGYTNIVTALLKHPATDPNCTNEVGVSSLCIAAYLGDEATVATLLADPRIDVNKADKSNQTPLQHAIHKKQVAIVKMLFKHPKLSVDRPEESGLNLLQLGTDSGNREIVNLLLTALKEKGRLHDLDQLGILKSALRSCSVETVIDLLTTLDISASHVFPTGWTLMNVSCLTGNSGMVDWLLKNGVDPNTPDNANVLPLMCALIYDSPLVYRTIFHLMQAGADVSKIQIPEDRSKAVRSMGNILTQTLISAKLAPQTAAHSGTHLPNLVKPDDPIAVAHFLFESMSAMSSDQQAVLLAGVLLHSVSEFDLSLGDHPWLMKFLRLEFLAQPRSRVALLERVHQKIKLWDGQGFDGAGQGSFSVLKTDRGRLPLLTREIFQLWTGIAPEVFPGKS
jgi:ankyrin repeat protein